MLKTQNRNTRTSSEISSKLTTKTPPRRHWPRSDTFFVNFTYFTRYWRASIVDFDQGNICYEPVLWISIYPRARRHHCSTVFIFNFEHISHLVLVLLLLILSMYLIAGFDISYFSRFIVYSVFFIKDFHEVECTTFHFFVKTKYIFYKL